MVLPKNPRIKSKRRTRARLPFEQTESDSRDVPVAKAVEVFRKRTGIDPSTDTRLTVLMCSILNGLEERKQPAGKRSELRITACGDDVEPVRTVTTRGHPSLPRNLTAPLQILVDWLGPADAALALLIFRLHTHPALMLRKTETGADEAFDLSALRDLLESRLERIASRRAADPNPTLIVDLGLPQGE